MPFLFERSIHFADTDAAGVVFFANYLAICHEAYEEALGAAGIDLGRFFKDSGTMIPVAKSEAQFLRPLHTGDRVRVALSPKALSENSFEIRYEVARKGPPEKRAAVIRTEHVCIASATRARLPLSPPLLAWVQAG